MNKRKAFTLIEMLVVITIIGMLALLVLTAFGYIGQQAKLDVAADSLVSAVKGQQGLAKSGKVISDGDGEKLCYGIYFSKEEPYVQYVEAPYVLVGAVGTSDADFCNIAQHDLRDFDAIEDLRVLGIQENGQDREEFVILFKPPFAKVLLSNSINVIPGAAGNEEIIVSIALPNNDEEIKSIRFGAAAGLTERIYE